MRRAWNSIVANQIQAGQRKEGRMTRNALGATPAPAVTHLEKMREKTHG